MEDLFPVEYIDPKTAKPHPQNFTTHNDKQRAALEESMDNWGWLGTPILNKRTGNLLDGHLRLERALARGDSIIPVRPVDVPPEEELRILAAFNRIAQLAETDEEKLAGLMLQLSQAGVQIPGWDEKDIAGILSRFRPEPEHLATDELPDEVPPRARDGDVWRCGRHRILCGSSVEPASVFRLFAGAEADQVVTDPPYGIEYSEKAEFLNKYAKGNRNETPILNDEIVDHRDFYRKFLALARLAPKNTCYVFMASQQLHNLRMALEDARYHFQTYLVWVKNNHVLGRMDYLAKHEFIAYGWRGRHEFFGEHRATVLEYDRPQKSEEHPTMKPVELVKRLIEDGSRPGAIVYDPFLGSGTTLVACEELGRTCYAVELSRRYTDLSLARWEEMTGEEAEREGECLSM